MTQIKDIIEKTLTDMVKDPASVALAATREAKEVVLFEMREDLSVIAVTKDGNAESQKTLTDLSVNTKFSKSFNKYGKVILALAIVKKVQKTKKKSTVEVQYYWSSSTNSTIMSTSLMLRVWGSLTLSAAVASASETDSIGTLLTKYKTINPGPDSKTYACREDVATLPYDAEVSSFSPPPLEGGDANARIYRRCYNFEIDAAEKEKNADQRLRSFIQDATNVAEIFDKLKFGQHPNAVARHYRAHPDHGHKLFKKLGRP